MSDLRPLRTLVDKYAPKCLGERLVEWVQLGDPLQLKFENGTIFEFYEDGHWQVREQILGARKV